jgi:hypothetical protein
MPSYVLYTRSVTGLILRNGHVVLHGYNEIDPYVHEETLSGWPESKVFWDRAEGVSTGLAPFDP